MMRILQDRAFDLVEVGGLYNIEFSLSGGLDLDRAKAENSLEDSSHLDGYVLHARDGNFRDFAVKKSPLLYINDSSIGDDPHVEKVVHPRDEYEKANPHKVEDEPKRNERIPDERAANGHSKAAERKSDGKDSDQNKGKRRGAQHHDPVLVDEEDDLFLGLELEHKQVSF